MSERLGIGVVGCGVMGRSLVQGLAGIEEARLVAVADVKEEAIQELLAHWTAEMEKRGTPIDPKEVRTYSTAQELVQDEGVEAVLIATPGFLHREAAEAAARAKKHIFSEKPLATTVADCDAMLQAAEKVGVVLMVGQVCRFHAVHRKVKELVAEGAIGEPICLTVHRLGGRWGGVWRQSWRMRRALCGGALMEVNAHELDWARWVMGEVRRVFAMGRNFINLEQDYPDVALVTLEFVSGALGWLHSSQASELGGYGARVDGREGSILIPSFWGSEAGLRYKRQGAEAQWIPASSLTVEPPVQAELRAFVEAVRRGSEPPVTGWDGRMAVAIAEAAYRSIETGRPEEVP